MTVGKFITVEGIEGVGKSTNIDYLAKRLRSRGIDVLLTREPGGTPRAAKIREILLTATDEPMPDVAELLLFFASRALHLENTIRPALEAGTWVICDRFTDASRAYQGAGRVQDPARVDVLADWVHGDLNPDLTLLLDAPPHVGLARVRARGAADRLDSEDIAFYERVRSAYLALADNEPARFEIVDASGTLDEVQASIRTIVGRILDNK